MIFSIFRPWIWGKMTPTAPMGSSITKWKNLLQSLGWSLGFGLLFLLFKILCSAIVFAILFYDSGTTILYFLATTLPSILKTEPLLSLGVWAVSISLAAFFTYKWEWRWTRKWYDIKTENVKPAKRALLCLYAGEAFFSFFYMVFNFFTSVSTHIFQRPLYPFSHLLPRYFSLLLFLVGGMFFSCFCFFRPWIWSKYDPKRKMGTIRLWDNFLESLKWAAILGVTVVGGVALGVGMLSWVIFEFFPEIFHGFSGVLFLVIATMCIVMATFIGILTIFTIEKKKNKKKYAEENIAHGQKALRFTYIIASVISILLCFIFTGCYLSENFVEILNTIDLLYKS